MGVDKNIIRVLHELNAKVHKNAERYHHSRPISVKEHSIIMPGESKHSFDIIYDLKDLTVIAAITESPILLTGGTDTGKTTLAKLVMNGLLGPEEEGWHRIDFDLDFGKDTYTDVSSDFFHQSGKTTKDLYNIQPWLKLPGFIADELNRSHPKVASKALHIINEKEITLANGRREKVGHMLSDGTSFQFQIATINEGSEYHGVFEMDKALRRRTTIEFPMDIFPLTPYDRLMLQASGKVQIEPRNKTSNLETLLEISEAIENLSLHPIAELFVSFLGSFDYCRQSLTEEKGSVQTINGSISHICTKPVKLPNSTTEAPGFACDLLKNFGDNPESGLCPYVRGITPGITKNLIAVSKGFALMRATKFVEMLNFSQQMSSKDLAYSLRSPNTFTNSLQSYIGKELKGKDLIRAVRDKYINELEVEQEDVEAAIHFVGYSKVGISPLYVNKYYQGNHFAAVEAFINEASSKYIEGISRPELEDLGELLNNGADPNKISLIEHIFKKNNPWFWRTIQPYLMKDQPPAEIDIDQLYRD